MPQEFYVLQCQQCKAYSVNMHSKTNKWQCKLCGTKQSIVKVIATGTAAKDLRLRVQQLNMRRGQQEEVVRDALNDPRVARYQDAEQQMFERVRQQAEEYSAEAAAAADADESADTGDDDESLYTTQMPDEIIDRKKGRKRGGDSDGNGGGERGSKKPAAAASSSSSGSNASRKRKLAATGSGDDDNDGADAQNFSAADREDRAYSARSGKSGSGRSSSAKKRRGGGDDDESSAAAASIWHQQHQQSRPDHIGDGDDDGEISEIPW